MMIKELFEGLVGDYCIARNTIKCLFVLEFPGKVLEFEDEISVRTMFNSKWWQEKYKSHSVTNL